MNAMLGFNNKRKEPREMNIPMGSQKMAAPRGAAPGQDEYNRTGGNQPKEYMPQNPQMMQNRSINQNPSQDLQMQQGDLRQAQYLNTRADEIERQNIEFMRKCPTFDMKTEIQNPDFVKYIWGHGLSVEEAYFLVHREDIIDEEVRRATDKMLARRGRISENGAAKSSPAAVVKKNPKDMSDKEIDKIIERVKNGEKVSF